MEPINPYRAPRATIKAPLASRNLEKLADGQRLIAYAILSNFLYFAVAGAQAVMDPGSGEWTPSMLGMVALMLIAQLVGIGTGIAGLLRVSGGLGISPAVRILMILLIVVPISNLVALYRLNSRVTSKLRAAGYEVGFLGASKN